jgi:small subunit ribosomal protein S1
MWLCHWVNEEFYFSVMTTATSTQATNLSENFAALFEESLTRQEMRTGEVITAEVVRVDANFVVVNAGLKSESYIAIDEFRNDRGELEVHPGEFVQVAIEALENGYGETQLSGEGQGWAWHELEAALEQAGSAGLVNGKVKVA